MNFRPNATRKKRIFESASSAMGFFVCLTLCAVTVFGIAGYAAQTLLPEISVGTVCFFSAAVIAATGIAFMFSAEWIVYPALSLCGLGAAVLFFIPLSEAVSEKITKIGIEIYKFEPEYYIPYYSGELTIAAILLASACAVLITHFILRCKPLVPIIFTSAVTLGLFVSFERNESMHLYILVLCIISMLCVAVQGKAGKAMGVSLPVTRIGVKTLAFLLSAAIVLIPVASDEEFSVSVMNAISQLTGIKPPTVSPGGFGDASGEVSMDGYEQFMNDLEEKQSQTDLEDVEFDNILLYIVSGADDSGDMFLRRRIHYEYGNNAWTLSTSTSTDLTDDAFRFLADTQDRTDSTDVIRSFVTVAGVVKPLYPAIPAGSTLITNGDDEAYYDLDSDGVPERYPAITTDTYRLADFEYDEDWFDYLRRNTDIDWGYEAYGLKDYQNPELYVSGDETLDKELRALMLDLLGRYFGYQSFDEWLAAEDSVIDAIEAVQIYLSETKFYTMNPQMSDRYENYDHEEDSIYNFLFNTGEGYCVQFASTAALLLRSIGINTRYVTGYSSRGADFGGTRYIYDSNSHAWCEVELYGYGWVPFEMTYAAMQNSIGSEGPLLDTPHFREEISVPEVSEEESYDDVSEESSEAESSEEESLEESVVSDVSDDSSLVESVGETSADQPKNNKKAIIYCICIAFCGIILTLAAALIYRRNEKRRKNTKKTREEYSKGEGDPQKGLIELHSQHIELLKLKGFAPLKGEKYPEYIKRVRRSAPDMPNPAFVMEYFRKAEFGGVCTKEELAAAGKHMLDLNDHVFDTLKGFKKKKAYFKGILTKKQQK